MVLKDWAEVRKLDEECNEKMINTLPRWTTRGLYFWMVAILLFGVWGAVTGCYRYGWAYILPSPALAWAAGVFFWREQWAFPKAFKDEYEQHGIAGYTFGTRGRYLRYALFLRSLKDQDRAWSRDDITRLLRFADTRPKPEPPMRILQNPLLHFSWDWPQGYC
jgi:hypothetical protein